MNRKVKKPMSMPMSVLLGMGSAMVITLILTAAAAWMITAGKVNMEGKEYIGLMITAISVFAGSVAAIALSDKKKMLVSGIAAAAYLLVLLSCTAVFFGGIYHGVLKTVAVSALCWLVSQFVFRKRTVKGRPSHKKRAYR